MRFGYLSTTLINSNYLYDLSPEKSKHALPALTLARVCLAAIPFIDFDSVLFDATCERFIIWGKTNVSFAAPLIATNRFCNFDVGFRQEQA